MERRDWNSDPEPDMALRWWDGTTWHVPDAIVSLRPDEPLLSQPTRTFAAMPASRPVPPRVGSPWADPPPSHREPQGLDDDRRSQRPPVPAAGLTALLIVIIAGVFGLSVAVRDYDPAASAQETPAANTVTLPARGDRLPRSIDQPWKRTSAATGRVSFEFPATAAVGTRQLDGGVTASSVDVWQELDARVVCYAADFRGSGWPPLDFSTPEGRSTLVQAELLGLRSSPALLAPITTPVGPGTRFTATVEDAGLAIRGAIVGSGPTATWCMTFLPTREASLADLTVERIVSTLAPRR